MHKLSYARFARHPASSQINFSIRVSLPRRRKLVTIADISEVIVKAPFADTVAAELKVG